MKKHREKLAFLTDPASYSERPETVEVRETHTAYLFLAGNHAYKLKKPVRMAHLNQTRLSRRKHYCAEELRLNEQLAPGVYECLVALTREQDGRLAFNGSGTVIDWLLKMKRLSESEFLSNRLEEGRIGPEEITAIARALSGFYRSNWAKGDLASGYFGHLLRESRLNSEHLEAMRDHLDERYSSATAEAAIDLVESRKDEICRRAMAGLVVDGHGDLRPEHVCLLERPVIIGRPASDPAMRQIDIYDEVNYLGLECENAGHAWIRELLLNAMNRMHGNQPSEELLVAYGAFRMLLRARVSIDRLLERNPRTPEKWPAQANAYLARATELLASLH